MMQRLHKTTQTIAAAAALGAVVFAGTTRLARAQAAAGQPAAQEKKVKDQGEFDIYNEANKDLFSNPPNFTKAVTDLDTWKQKYPESDFKDDRLAMYVSAYSGSKQFGRALDVAGELLSRDLNTVFNDPKTGSGTILRLLFTTTQATLLAIGQNANLSPQQLATAEKAARALNDFNQKPAGVSDADWANARRDLQNAANAALLNIAILPGNQAMAKPQPSVSDCQTAETVYTRAVGAYPDKSIISYNLGRALNCIARATPERATEVAPRAIYSFVRAAVIDPTLGGSADGKKIAAYADDAYSKYHGSDEGLAQIKEQAKAAPLPPPGFAIETAAAVAVRKQNEFKEKYPQLALWLGIKAQLAEAATGTQYFEGQLKDAQVPKLKGMIVEGKPECRSRELLIAVPPPDQQGTPQAEITLKLDKALTGKPDLEEIQWEGVPSAFSSDPFMLTMDTEQAKIEGLKTSPCTPARGGARKAPTKKK